jgi:hypothetical protein
MNLGQGSCELKDELSEMSGCEFRLSLKILDDDVWLGENLAGLIEVIRRWHGQSERVQEVQELEFICCYLRVVFEVRIPMLTDNHFLCLAIRSLNLKRRHLR